MAYRQLFIYLCTLICDIISVEWYNKQFIQFTKVILVLWYKTYYICWCSGACTIESVTKHSITSNWFNPQCHMKSLASQRHNQHHFSYFMTALISFLIQLYTYLTPISTFNISFITKWFISNILEQKIHNRLVILWVRILCSSL